jgi:hypothetical protein
MKKLFIATLLTLTFVQSYAQHTISDVFNGKAKVIFLGLDFTQAKYIGSPGFTDPNAIQNQHMVSWNTLIKAEPKKFSLVKPLKLRDDQYSAKVSDMIKHNKNANVADNIINEAYTLTESQARKAVSGYTLTEKDGVGVVYVVESLNKTLEKMTVWVTFVDLATKKVLLIEKVEGKPAGFGFRNYWAGAVYKINGNIGSNYYKKWSQMPK